MTPDKRPVIAGSDMITPYGRGTSETWEGLMSAGSAISRVKRFSTTAFKAETAGIIEGLEYHGDTSLVMQMIESLLEGVEVPEDARLYLATTKGEIDILEKAVLSGEEGDGAAMSNPSVLLQKLMEKLSLSEGRLVSAACASGSSALAMAASDITHGRTETALVIACDSVTEFVYSGFSSLMAIDPDKARPFDRERSGLSVGEAAAYAIVASPQRARQLVSGEGSAAVCGWGMSSDANHMTGPSRDGMGLYRAIEKALRMAEAVPGDIGSVSAHGTGTIYNDSMEMKAFELAFSGSGRRPVYSVKGGMGHSMGAAGLVEALLAVESILRNSVPPTVGTLNVDPEADGWVTTGAQDSGRKKMALTTNSGFGGINAALVLGSLEGPGA